MNLGLQEGVWIAVGLLAVYAVMQLGRFHGLRRAPRKGGSEESAAAPPAGSGLELEVQQLRRELALLREDMAGIDAAWRETAGRLEAELLRLREGLEGLQAERGVAPQYGEAMVLARRGLAAEAIAERCGISVAEAALVRSLVQRGGQAPGEAA